MTSFARACSSISDVPASRELSHHLFESEFHQLFADAALEDRSRLLSVSSQYSGLWLSAIPYEVEGLASTRDLRLSSQLYRVALLLRLGLPLPKSLTSHSCVCGTQPDPSGHHFTRCGHADRSRGSLAAGFSPRAPRNERHD